MTGRGAQVSPLATDFLKFIGKVAAKPDAEGTLMPDRIWIVPGDRAEKLNPMAPQPQASIPNIEPKPSRSRTP
jgi:hypothetical protein